MLTELAFSTFSPAPTVSPIPGFLVAPPISSPGSSSTPHDTDLKQSTHAPGSVPRDMPLPVPAAPKFTGASALPFGQLVSILSANFLST
ncbi:hypothetical protein BC827DRAFT_1173030 [Russula dissimulans]|nr:hypothetical protein BC827DRAFT_1173030 [Russula dissimulans]